MSGFHWSMRMLRRALRCYPRPFRQRHGVALLQTLEDRLAADWHRRSSLGRAALLMRMVSRCVVDGCFERVRGLASPRVSSVAVSVLGQELRGAMMALRRRPRFFLMAVVTQATAIGAATAIYSVLDGVVLRPLPYPEPNELVVIGRSVPEFGDQLFTVSLPVIRDLRDEATFFPQLAAVRGAAADATVGGTAHRMAIAGVSAEFFEMFGVVPQAGRLLGPHHDLPDAPLEVVLSHDLAGRVFGSADGAVGRHIIFDGVDFRVLGVTPAGFVPPEGIGMVGTSAWFPLMRMFLDRPLERRGYASFRIVARMETGVDRRTAGVAVAAFAARQAASYPEAFGRDPLRLVVRRLHDVTVAEAAPRLWLLMGAVTVFVAIGCVNLIGLFLARATDRHGELALRAALGASRARLAVHAFAESVLTALAAAAIGLGLAWAGIRALRQFPAGEVPRADNVMLNWRVAAFAVVAALVTGLIVGITPAVRAARTAPGRRLQTVMRSAARGGANRRARSAFLAVEAALAVVLTVGAGAFLEGLARLNAIDLGFSGVDVMRAEVHLGATFFQRSRDAQIALQEDVRRAVERLPGVARISSTFSLPLEPYAPLKGGVTVATEERPDRLVALDIHTWVGAGYFSTLRVPVLEGREFSVADQATDGDQVVVSRSTAVRLWGVDDVAGRRLRVARPDGAPGDWSRVVGVVGDVAARGPAAGSVAALYFPDRANVMGPSWNLLIRHDADADALASGVRSTISTVAPDVPVGVIEPLEAVHSRVFAEPRFFAFIFGVFAFVAVLLAMAGIHGTLAYVVSQGIRDVGIRMALGASGREVRGQVLRMGVIPVAAGVGIGALAVTVIGPTLTGLVRGVAAPDATVLGAGTLLMIAAGVAASWGPARRAQRADPVSVMRE